VHAPAFWWREPGIASALLSPFAAIYGALAKQRFDRPGVKVGIPILCVGNPTVGGAGKTPTALSVARFLIAAGERPAFLSRGYGGRMGGPVRVDPSSHTAADVGDEPLLLAQAAPTIVARDRAAGADFARQAGASVIVMDDGFQNPSLTKDLSILVIDARRGAGNGRIFPAGPLRLDLEHQLDRAGILLVIGTGDGAGAIADQARTRNIPIFRGQLEPDKASIAAIREQEALAFAGIGDPEKFFQTLERCGIKVRVRRSFPDHHRYTAADAAALIGESNRLGLVPLTTEKDLVRLASNHEASIAALKARTRALPVTLTFDQEAEFKQLILDALGRG
jgi:tetraacyldisaccharide 4'-kinase